MDIRLTEDNRPPIGGLRLLDTGKGYRQLARDIARQEGTPVAVVGPGAVECVRCEAVYGAHCTEKGRATDFPHMERVVLMNKEIARLLKAEGK